MMPRCGVVVIGRNEGERLKRCLQSLAGNLVVYVDSGSTDSSVENSRELGALVVELDMSAPFTAAKARNAGMQKLLTEYSSLEVVQFVDGDCQVVPGWMDAAVAELDSNPGLAAVCGRRREIHRSRSIYNLLCDVEWDSPVGVAASCGGDAMYRVAAFCEVGQFDEKLIAGEEPELCYRLRQEGWSIKRLDMPMTDHDADMYSIRQWWRRCQRSGYAYALGAWKHGMGAQQYNVKQCLSVLFWGAGIPSAVFALLLIKPIMAVLMLAGAYGYLGCKIYWRARRQHLEFTKPQIRRYAAFVVLQKFPELVGVLRCSWHSVLGRKMNIIEYK